MILNIRPLQIQPYVDSANDTTAGAMWPLVRRARLTGPWGRHIGSAVLVDAPGVQDDNSARDRLVRGESLGPERGLEKT